ncbi:MAG: AsmA family protein, partial [Elusimicrobia bacterium]|nr:AsmA family protein [Elusimicrobiota bacterium]
MKKSLLLLVKIGVGLAVLAAVALIALSLALKKFLPPDKVRELILTQSRKHLNREVRLQSVELGALSGLVVKGLEVSERPDFKAGKFVGVDSFQLRVKLVPLLYRSVVIDSVKAGGLDARIVRRKDGSFNFSDLLAPATAAAPAPEAQAGLPFSLKVSQAALQRAALSFDDAVTGAQVKVSALDAKVWNLSPTSPCEADLSLAVNAKYQGRTHDAKLAWKGRADYAGGQLSKMSVSSKKLALEYSGIRLEATGRVSNLEAPDLDLEAALALQGAAALDLTLKD